MSAPDPLLRSLVDYAGLFPPAGLPMADAARNYASYRRGPHASVLGRFIVPLARLPELEAECARLPAADQADWRLSVLAGNDPPADSAALQAFNSRQPRMRIVSLETKAATPADVARLTSPFPSGLEVWVEVPARGDTGSFIAAIKSAGRGDARAGVMGAKLRTGGVTPEAFPPAGEVVRFMAACRATGVVFKATAGLHHPLRGEYALTYEPGGPRGMMFGFLNVFLAAALIRSGGAEPDASALLVETDPEAFAVAPAAVAWRDHRFTAADLAATRRDFCRSFGSCSFTEPIAGLQELHWL